MEIAFLALMACLLLLLLLAASEAALAANNRVHLRHVLQSQSASSADDTTAQRLSGELSGDAQRFVATVTIAGSIPLLAAASLTAFLARSYFSETRTALAVCAAAALAVLLLFQIVPRLLASRAANTTSLWWLRPAWLLIAALRLPVLALLLLGNGLLKMVGLSPRAAVEERAREDEEDGESGLGTPEIRDLVENAQTSGALREDNRELIESIFDFGDTHVHDVMLPRPDILAVPENAPLAQVLDALQESGFSRLPVMRENVDHIVGVLHARDALRVFLSTQPNETITAQTLMREPLFVTENQRITDALATMRRARNHQAIVIDEFGGTAGLLTVEDVLEELVGDIADEHDHREQQSLHIVSNETALALATLHTEDLEDRWNLHLPVGEFDTVGGFMIEQLGRALVVGDRVETDDAVLTVQSVRRRRPHRVLLTRKQPPPFN